MASSKLRSSCSVLPRETSFAANERSRCVSEIRPCKWRLSLQEPRPITGTSLLLTTFRFYDVNDFRRQALEPKRYRITWDSVTPSRRCKFFDVGHLFLRWGSLDDLLEVDVRVA